MKKKHVSSLKLHSFYSIGLSVVFCTVVLVRPDATLAAAALAVVLYVAGNGIIHSQRNSLSRDTLLEYALVAIIVLFLLVSAVL